MKFLIEGSHGPVDPEEGRRLAQELVTVFGDLLGRGVVDQAWAREGGGRVLIVDADDRAQVDALLATLPGPASQEWAVFGLTDLVAGLDQYLRSLDAGPAT